MIRVEITGDSYAEIEAQLMGFLANPSATIEPDQMGFTLEKQKLTKDDLDRPFEDEHATKQAIKRPEVTKTNTQTKTEPKPTEEKAYTLEEVRAAAMSKLDGPRFKALLSQLGAKNLTTLDPAKYGELMELIDHA
ncbi:hypothetical protein [Dubosiella newyorkensis]|uniref:rRNA biogenesis protein rrp5 n=2 Tax=Dubosiella newyorkensis TaxID=1862672 RepID=A0A1U7NMU8_9FIRM|nr:hypothetical protein [Dubosiella newyorkensis]OLU46613.1 hypothetical protein BO225_05430 [Dubosiella newyorkensis]